MNHLFLIVALGMTLTTANAQQERRQSRIEPGSENAVKLVDFSLNNPSEFEHQPSLEGRGGGSCQIINHTPYENNTGVACVNCGGTYVSVAWHIVPNATFGLHPRVRDYHASVVSNCNW